MRCGEAGLRFFARQGLTDTQLASGLRVLCWYLALDGARMLRKTLLMTNARSVKGHVHALPLSRFWRDPALPYLVDARTTYLTSAPFRLHTHDAWMVALVEAGSSRVQLGGRDVAISAGEVVGIQPGMPHACNPASGEVFHYLSFFLSPAWVEARAPGLASGLYRDVAIARLTRKAAKLLAPGGPESPCRMAKEEAFEELFRALSEALPAVRIPGSSIRNRGRDGATATTGTWALAEDASQHSDSHPDSHPDSLSDSRPDFHSDSCPGLHPVLHPVLHPDPCSQRSTRRDALQAVRSYLESNLTRMVTLEELTRLTGGSATQLLRAFRSEMGLSPHAWQMQRRVEAAKSLLLAGMPAGDVAQETGFADQSHLCRVFKRYMGATPGQYQAGGRNIVQAKAATPW